MMRDYFKRVGFGLLVLAGCIVVPLLWLFLPAWWMLVTESWLVRVLCIAWMMTLPVFGFAALDDGGAPNLVLRRPPLRRTK